MEEKGFTLLETTIVIAITMILSAVMLGYSRSNEKQIALYRDQAIIVGVINRAKSLALQRFNNPDNPNEEICAFGVNFKYPKTFILFKDIKKSTMISCKDDITGNYGGSGGYDANEEFSAADIFTLDSKLVFRDISGDQSGNLIFIPPDLEIKIDTSSPFIVNIQSTDGSLCSSVEVGAGGQITESNC